MPRYLTVGQYKSFDTGMTLPNDLTLAHVISQAESDIDDHMGFDPLLGGFEPHSAWFQHQWDQQRLRTPFPNEVVPLRLIDRYRIQVSNISTSGAGFFATINPGDCVLNEFEDYIEIVPLQAITYALSPVILQLGLRKPIVQVDAELGFYLPQLGEVLYTTDSLTYQSTRAYWASSYSQALSTQPNTLPPVPPVVYKNGVVQSSGFSINYTEGLVVFSAAQGAAVITADYTYQIPDRVRDCAIIQTNYLLGQRDLNKLGMQGVEQVRSGFQQIKRHMSADLHGEHDSALHADAAAKLAGYRPIAIA